MVVKAAEADAEAKFLAGTGIARQRQAIINGLRGLPLPSGDAGFLKHRVPVLKVERRQLVQAGSPSRNRPHWVNHLISFLRGPGT